MDRPDVDSRVHRLLLALVASLVLIGAMTVSTAAARASGISFDSSPGTSSPPATLGPYSMTPFGADSQPIYTNVSSVTGPNGTTVNFANPLYHVQVGNGWNTWSNGYAGDVYWDTDGTNTTTILLPNGTNAFYFYAEPDPYATFEVTATAADGTTSGPIQVAGYQGAQYYGFYTDRSAPLSSITVTSPVDFAIGEFGISTGAAVKPNLNYVALGDSYSSGEGNPPFLPGTDGGSDYCHRSDVAYPESLASVYSANLKFYACSGATTSDVVSTTHYTEGPQLSESGVDPTANLVTLTIGGNDAGFSSVLISCIKQKLIADAVGATTIGTIAGWLGLGPNPSCAASDTFTSSVAQQIDNVFWPVKQTYQAIVAQTDPVHTSILALDYPHIFPTHSDAQGCLQLSPFLTSDDQNFLNNSADQLDYTLQSAAGQAGVNFVDVRSAFDGHGVCGSDGAWVNGISFASGNAGQCYVKVLGVCIVPGLPIVGSFHPNANGQTQGYAQTVQQLINTATSQTPEGLPADPVPLPDPPGSPSTGADSISALTVTPLTTSTAGCEGTFQAGQRLQVTASGFLPGTGVRVYVTSPGQPSPEELVATVTADASGAIDATIRVPLTATGFVQQGTAVGGEIGLDAIGLGSKGSSHADATALQGLVAHGSECGTVDTLPFTGFTPPVSNPPTLNPAQAGSTIPVKFTIAGSDARLGDIVAAGYPQSAPVSCAQPDQTLTSGDATNETSPGSSDPSDDYHYNWQTDASWSGCRELIVRLVDGSYHRAIFSFR